MYIVETFKEKNPIMAYHSFALTPNLGPIDQALLDKHLLRKHGATAYYGQNTSSKLASGE